MKKTQFLFGFLGVIIGYIVFILDRAVIYNVLLGSTLLYKILAYPFVIASNILYISGLFRWRKPYSNIITLPYENIITPQTVHPTFTSMGTYITLAIGFIIYFLIGIIVGTIVEKVMKKK